MRTTPGPPPTPASVLGWERITIPSQKRTFLVHRGRAGEVYVPESASIARDLRGRPRVALTLVLSRMPSVESGSVSQLVVSGHLSLLATLAADADDVLALQRMRSRAASPMFVRDARGLLAGAEGAYAAADIIGAQPQFWLGCALPPDAALDVLRAFDGGPSRLEVVVQSQGADAPPFAAVPLDRLLAGILDGFDRTEYISMIVVFADGTSVPVPALKRDVPGTPPAQREGPESLPMMATPRAFVALPYVLAPDHAAHPSAAALIAGGATGEGVRINATSQYWLAHDALIATNSGGDTGPKEHLPMVDTMPSAPLWADALDAKTMWYAPVVKIVSPAAGDPPAKAAFAFEYESTGTTLGPKGAEVGLSATIRLTLRATMSPETEAALVAAGNPAVQPVPLNSLACSLEIPYREHGSTAQIVQRFSGTIVTNGDAIVMTVALLDDWVRLAYSVLAYPPAAGIEPPRVVVDYAFAGYAWGGRVAGGAHVVGGGKIAGLAHVATMAELPAQLDRPVLVEDRLTVVGPRSFVQYRREAPRPRTGSRAPSSRLTAASLQSISAHSAFVDAAVFPARHVIRRTIVREDTAVVDLPCASFGAFYRQKAADGTTTAIGCQDALRLGESSARAFDEIIALRTSGYRVYRSLQQPGRFLAVPAAYRVGRYADGDVARAFRPIIVLYGALDPDPAKNAYALATTLVPDVSGYALALLATALRAYTPATMSPEIVFPTDPFVGAKTTYAWTVPQGLSQPQALTVVDVVNVTLSMAMRDAALLMTMLDRSGVQGAITFTLPDGTAYQSALTIDGKVVGPPGGSAAPATVSAGIATITNRAQQSLDVLDAALIDGAGNATSLAINATLAAGESVTVTVPAATVSCVTHAELAAKLAIDELDVFVEDVVVVVTFINQVTFANHQITALQVRARLKDSEHIEVVDVPEGKTAGVSITVPITTYLKAQTLQYALSVTTATGTSAAPWHDWDLTAGTVIGITADII